MDIIIYGTGKFAEYAAYALTHDTEHNVHGFCIKKKLLKDIDSIGNLPVHTFETIERYFPPNEYQMFIAVGLNKIRAEIFQEAKQKKYKMISYLCSQTTTWDDLEYGENTWIGEGSIIQPFVTIGDNTILFGAKIGHHSTLGNHALLSETTLGGDVSVGDFSMLGLRSTIKHNVKIGKNNIVGMGSSILRDTGDNEIHQLSKTTVKRKIGTDKFEKRYL